MELSYNWVMISLQDITENKKPCVRLDCFFGSPWLVKTYRYPNIEGYC